MIFTKTKRLLLVGGLIIFLDLVTKYLVIKFLTAGGWWLSPGYGFKLLANQGAALGLFNNVSLLPLTLTLTVILIIWFYHARPLTSPTALAIIIGGAMGNIIDRLVNGAVTDFIVLGPWPTSFNLADLAITVGVIWLLLKETKKVKGQNSNRKTTTKNPKSFYF